MDTQSACSRKYSILYLRNGGSGRDRMKRRSRIALSVTTWKLSIQSPTWSFNAHLVDWISSPTLGANSRSHHFSEIGLS
jgi:hypothetical protein